MKIRTNHLVQLALVFSILTIIAPVYCQVPDAFKYQAIARDSEGNPIADQSVGFLIRIRQGSVTGTDVYAETHSTTTNGYGLANLELGRGTSIGNDPFDSISWADGPYFIEISLDASGGTAYQLLGTSPLLSVPYAMYAQRAESVAMADSAMLALQATSADFADSAMHAKQATNADWADSAMLALQATNADFADSAMHAKQAADADWADSATYALQAGTAAVAESVAGLPIYNVGDTVQGGVVFYVDATGRHGLVAALSEQSQGIIWGDAGRGILGIKGVFGGALVMGAGYMNTAVIAAAHPNITTAAHLCLQYTGGGYGDWYLPSTTEARLLVVYLYENNVLPDINTFFWTSDENGSGDNLAHLVSPFSISFRIQKNTTRWAWAIRRF